MYTRLDEYEKQLLQPEEAVAPLITPPEQTERRRLEEQARKEYNLNTYASEPARGTVMPQEIAAPRTEEELSEFISRLPTLEDKRNVIERIRDAKGARQLKTMTEILGGLVGAGKISLGVAETAIANLANGWGVDPAVGISGIAATGIETLSGTELAADVAKAETMDPLRETLSRPLPPYSKTGKEVAETAALGFEAATDWYKNYVVDPAAGWAGRKLGPNAEGTTAAVLFTLPVAILEKLGIRARLAGEKGLVPTKRINLKPKEFTKSQRRGVKYLPTVRKASKEREAAYLLTENIISKPETWAAKFEEGMKIQDTINATIPEGQPKFRFDLAQLSEDPKTARFKSQMTKRFGPAGPALYDLLMKRNVEILKDYMKKMKPKGKEVSVRKALEEKRGDLVLNLAGMRGGMRGIVTAMREGIDLERGISAIEKEINWGEKASRWQAGKLFDLVPYDYFNVRHLINVARKELKPSFHGESPSKTIPPEVRRGLQIIAKDRQAQLTAKELFDVRSGWTSILEDMRRNTENRNFRGERRMIRLIKAVDHILDDPDYIPRGEDYIKWLEKNVAGKKYFPGMTKESIRMTRQYYDAMDDIFQGKKRGPTGGKFTKGKAYFEKTAELYETLGHERGKAISPFKRAKDYFTYIERLYAGEGHIPGSARDSYKAARDYFFENVIKRYENKDIRDINRFEAGRRAISDSELMGKFWKSGQDGVRSARTFINAVGKRQPGNRGSWEALDMWIDNEFLNKVVDKTTGDINKNKFYDWKYNHKEALKEFGLEDRFTTPEASIKYVEDALQLRDQFDKSVAGKMLGYDVNSEIDALKTSANPVADAKSLMQAMKYEPRAVRGLQRALIEQLESIDINNISDVNALYNKMSGVYKVVFSNNKRGLKAIEIFQKALDKLIKDNKNVNLPDNFYAMEEFFKAIYPADISGIRTYRSLRQNLLGWFPQIGKDGVKQIALDIMLNPETADMFMQIAKNKLPPRLVEQKMKRYVLQMAVPVTAKMLTVPPEEMEKENNQLKR